jgi:hypothetical protein
LPAVYRRLTAHGVISSLLLESLMKVTALLNRSVILTFLLSTSVTATKRITFLNRSLFGALLVFMSVSAFASPPHIQPLWHPPVDISSAPASLPVKVAFNSDAKNPILAASAQDTWTPAANEAAERGKTRAQVYAELVEAKEAGEIPTSKTRYPDVSPEMRKQNQQQFQQAEEWWHREGREEQLNASAR